MKFLRSEVFRSFAIGFALGAVALGANLAGTAEASGNSVASARR